MIKTASHKRSKVTPDVEKHEEETKRHITQVFDLKVFLKTNSNTENR